MKLRRTRTIVGEALITTGEALESVGSWLVECGALLLPTYRPAHVTVHVNGVPLEKLDTQ